MRTFPRRSAMAVTVLAVVALLATGCMKNGHADESWLRANGERTSRGIRSLNVDPTLAAKAQNWANHMAATGRVSHSNLKQDAGANWSVLGENVGWARSVAEAHSLFMGSASHRAAILDRRYSRMGAGVAVVGGRYYVVQVFAG